MVIVTRMGSVINLKDIVDLRFRSLSFERTSEDLCKQFQPPQFVGPILLDMDAPNWTTPTTAPPTFSGSVTLDLVPSCLKKFRSVEASRGRSIRTQKIFTSISCVRPDGDDENVVRSSISEMTTDSPANVCLWIHGRTLLLASSKPREGALTPSRAH
jgi:hypothetical protein